MGGDDSINGRGGDDTLLGYDGADQLNGWTGSDELDGGRGFDRTTFVKAGEAVDVDFSARRVAADGRGFADTVTEVEIVRGAKHQVNTLTGDDAANRLFGGLLADTLSGGDGSDQLWGEPAESAWGAGDTLNGGAGRDHLLPGQGANTIDGGTSSDTLNYYHAVRSTSGVSVSAGNGSGNASGAVSDTFTAIENLIGTRHDDTLTAAWNGTASFVRGRGGDDDLTVQDGDGLDTIGGGAGFDSCTWDLFVLPPEPFPINCP